MYQTLSPNHAPNHDRLHSTVSLKCNRNRGMVLSEQGWQKLAQAGVLHNKWGDRYTYEKLSERSLLNERTVSLTIKTGALVTRLLFEGTRTVGVEYVQEGMIHQVQANQEVILSAGAVDSPKLLLLSGIGNADYLQALGIPVVADLPGVGQNLQDHLLVSVVYAATQAVRPDISSNGVEAGLFLHSEGNLAIAPDLQFFFGPIQFLSPGYAPSKFGFTGAVSLTCLQNVGSVGLRPVQDGSALRSRDPNDTPMFQMNYLRNEADVQKLVAAIKLMRQLLHSHGFDEFRGKEIALGAEVQSDAALETYIRDTSSTVYHPVGTCKMGTDSMAVVDPELRVHRVEGLRVVDASIMPAITTGNTNAPTIMIGEKAADLIKASRIRQTLMTQYNVQNPAHLADLRMAMEQFIH